MTSVGFDLAPYISRVRSSTLLPWTGEVVELVGMLIASRGPAVAVGDFCEVQTSGGRRIRTQVIGFRDGNVLSMPLEDIDGIQLHDRIVARQEDARVGVGPELVGRVLDGFGLPIDRKPTFRPRQSYALYRSPGNPLDREHIDTPIATGIRSIDSLMPCGRGQRMGIFGGSGVGKSTLLGAMARHNAADITVIALIGERNREVRAFLERQLGEDGGSRCVVVCATSDRPAPLRIRACFVALAVAEYFRDCGANVLMIMDSVTRIAMAQREIGLAAARLHAVGVQPAAPHSGARRKLSQRVDHGILHRAGGRRRFQRTHLRRHPVHSGRTYYSVAQARGRRALSRDRRARLGEPAFQRTHVA
jgi:FliI/YscN family ATPase